MYDRDVRFITRERCARSRTMVFFTGTRDTERWTLPFKPVDPRRPPLGITERWILPIVPETAAAKSVREEGGGVSEVGQLLRQHVAAAAATCGPKCS